MRRWRELLAALINRQHLERAVPMSTVSGPSEPRPDLDEVNDASFDSFPASDSPPWSSMHAGAPPSVL